MKTKKWLASARYFDNNLIVTPNPDLSLAIDMITKQTDMVRQPHLVKEASGCILANLYINYLSDNPTLISLSKDNWTKSKNSEIEWSSYNTVSKILKILSDFGYIDQINGHYDKDLKKGYTGKYWLKSDTELIKTLNKCTIRKTVSTRPIIKLRDDKGDSVNYRKTNRTVKAMKRSLNVYNNINNSVVYRCSLQELYDDKPEKFEGRFTKTAYLLNTNQITLSIDGISIKYINKTDHSFLLQPLHYNKYYSICIPFYSSCIPLYKNTNIPYNNNHVIHHTTPLPQILGKLQGISNDIRYISAPNTDVYFDGEILNKSLFRVFNRASLSFDFGGRFYGASYQNMSKVIRNTFKIDGIKTVSLDYSGLHIRLCYHKIGIEYKGECYVYEKGENDVERKKIKTASLTIINAVNKDAAIKSLTDNRAGKGLTFDGAERIIKLFEDFHKPIKQFLFSDIGVHLQNLDSILMDNILFILYANDIIALPIHDEIICQRRHEKFVKEVMIIEYQKLMKFKPIIT